jgi:hypothetical protein
MWFSPTIDLNWTRPAHAYDTRNDLIVERERFKLICLDALLADYGKWALPAIRSMVGNEH